MSEHRDHEYRSSLSLRHTPGIGGRTLARLLGHYGSATAATAAARSWSKQGLARPAQSAAWLAGVWRQKADDEHRNATQFGMSVLLWSDEAYPRRLKSIPDAPAFLYYRGNIDLVRAPMVGIVGARDCSQYGRNMAARLAEDLSRAGVTIVSGFAMGIDRQAHVSALNGPGSTVAVLGTGLNVVYPFRNRDLWSRLCDRGLALTEFAPKTPPDHHNFPRRNRIISGLSLGIVVVEAASRSGSLITAMQALEQNRDVFAVPGPVDSPRHDGCHKLLRQGARLTRSAEDVLQELEPQLREFRHYCVPDRDRSRVRAGNAALSDDMVRELTAEQRKVVMALHGEKKLHLDALTRLLEWESASVSQVLTLLEIQGVVRQLPGMYYQLTGTENAL